MKKTDEVIRNIAEGVAMGYRKDGLLQKIKTEVRIPLERRMREDFPRHSKGWYDEKATMIIVAALLNKDVKHPKAQRIVAELRETFSKWNKMERPALQLHVRDVFPRMSCDNRDVIVARIFAKARKYAAAEIKGE